MSVPDGLVREWREQAISLRDQLDRAKTERDEARAALHEIARISYDVQYQVSATRPVVQFASHVHHIARRAVDPPREAA